MAYWFTGFFARSPILRPATLPAGACWRAITKPFGGIGVRFEELNGETPSIERIASLAEQLGLAASSSWIFLTYTCWGGRIDSVYGLVRTGMVQFGPVNESDDEKVRQAYLALMAQFGVSASDAENFEPFHRGFWGDA